MNESKLRSDIVLFVYWA